MAYGYYKDITIDKTKVLADLTDFPVLIKVTDANLAHTTHGGHCESVSGYDIGFKDADNVTTLSHELVAYNHETGAVVFWVNKPILDKDADDHIFMYYGNSSIVADQSSTNTWSSDYLLVAHGKDADTSHIHDSTSNANDGTKKAANEPTVYTSGKIHHAQDYDGTNDYIDFENNVIGTGNKTVSFWSYRDDDTAYQSYFSNAAQGGAANDDGIQAITTTGHHIQICLGNGATTGHYAQVVPPATDAVWHYIVITFNTSGTLLSAYVDDEAAVTSNTLSGSEVAGSTSMRLGTNHNSCPYDGKIEEFRVSNAVKSANWIHTEYHNQNDPATFMSFGVEQSAGGAALTKSLSTSVSVADSLSRQCVYQRTVAEGAIGLTESMIRSRGLFCAISESAMTLSESMDRESYMEQLLAELSIPLSDSLDRTVVYDRSLSEIAVGLSESLERECVYERTISESAINISESLAKQLEFSLVLSELAMQILEALVTLEGTGIFLTENISITESFARECIYNKVLSSSISIAENMAIQKTINLLIDDATSLYDSISVIRGQYLSLSESTIPITESINALFGLGLSLSETVTITDSLTTLKSMFRNISESAISLTESLDRQITYERTLSEIFGFTDFTIVFTGMNWTRAIIENSMTITDSLTRQCTYQRTIAESAISIIESLARQCTYEKLINENSIDIVDIINSLLINGFNIVGKFKITYTGGSVFLHKPYFNDASGKLMFNASNFSFRSGNYASHIDDLAGESIKIRGYENDDAMIKFTALGIVADEGLEITITNLKQEWNGVYIIENFSFRPIGLHDGLDVFEYDMDLKFVRYAP